MNSFYKKAIAILLVFACIASFASCKKSKTKKTNTSSESTSSVIISSEGSSSLDIDEESGNSNTDISDNELPVDIDDSVIDDIDDTDDDDDKDTDFDNDDFKDIVDSDEDNTSDTDEKPAALLSASPDYDPNYKNPIQEYGKAVSSSSRTISVSTDKAVWNNFHGFGANYFTQAFTPQGYGNLKYTQATYALDKERYTSDAAHIARVWFDIDFMVTSEQTEEVEDFFDNKDYQNYMNGIYDFNSVEMKSFYKYLDIWKEAGTDTAITFGWKVAKRIQSWFAIPGVNTVSGSAPYDLKAYSNACVALLNELSRRGYSNATKYLTFFNEPADIDQTLSTDFVTLTENKAYFATMLRYINNALKESGWSDKIEILAGENAAIFQKRTYSDYLYSNAANYLDTLSFHVYAHNANAKYSKNNQIYDSVFTLASLLKNAYRKKNVYITEYSTCPTKREYQTQYDDYDWKDWNGSNSGYFIAASNCGVGATLKWNTVAGYCCKLVNFYLLDDVVGHYSSSVDNLMDGRDINKIAIDTYFDLLCIWYIPDGSDVLMQSWTGDDIKVSCYKYKSDYTFLVEANDSAISSRILNFKLNKTLGGKTLYRYTFNPTTQVCNGNGTVPTSDKKITGVNSSFKDEIGKDYSCYFYSTIKPINQVEVKNISRTCDYGSSINVDAKMIDCSASDYLKYEVVAKSVPVNEKVEKADLGTVSSTGVFTPPASAEDGDYFAVKSYLASNPKVHAITLVYIEKD